MFISIIIPVYNSQLFIKRCIDSIKLQTLNDFECLLINDGSTDDSELIITREIKDDPRFILYNKQNGGVSSARNLGLDKAKGDFVIFVDSDDWLESELLQEIKKLSDDNDIIQYDFYKVSNTKNGEKKQEIHIKSNINFIIQGEGAVVWKRAFKRSLIDNNRFDESLSGGEDYLFCSKIFLKKSDFAYTAKCLYNYNITNINSAMSKNSMNIFIDQLIATKKVEKLLKEADSFQKFENDLYERYFWCLAEFNNWWLALRNKSPFIRRILVKIIKIILKKF